MKRLAPRRALALVFAASISACAGGGREESQQPEAVIALLGIDPGDVVFDLGAGDSSFTFRLAEAVRTSGRVLAVDPDADMTPDVDGVVDLVFVYDAYHRIPDRPAFFREKALAALVPNGRVAIIEPDGRGGTPAEQIEREMREAGFKRIANHDFLTRQSFQIFGPDDGTGE